MHKRFPELREKVYRVGNTEAPHVRREDDGRLMIPGANPVENVRASRGFWGWLEELMSLPHMGKEK